MNEFYYRPAKTLGQNLFCCPCSALVTDLTGIRLKFYKTFTFHNWINKTHIHILRIDSMKMCSIWQSWLCANKKQVKRWLHIGTAPCDDTIISKILVCCTRMSMRATLHKWFGWKRNILASAKLHRKRVKYLWSPTTIRQVSVYFIDLHALMPHELQPNLFKIHRIWLCRPSVRPSAGIFFFFSIRPNGNESNMHPTSFT